MTATKQKRTGFGCTLIALLVAAGGCGPTHRDNPATDLAAAEQAERGLDDGHGHACGAEATAASIEERANAACEHDVPIYRCDACRYEVGIVKLDASLLRQPDGSGLVRTQTVDRTKLAVALPAMGEVALNENVTAHISPRIAGIIDTVSADIGTRVKAGDILFTVNSVELGRALAEYERNRALTELSEKVFMREAKLREQQVGSEQDMIDAQMAYEQHRAELRASEQTLQVLGLTDDDLAALRAPHGVGTGRLPIRAPFAGTVIEKHAVPGELAEPGKDVMLLSDLTTVWAWVNVHSRDLATLLTATEHGPLSVEIGVAAFPDRRFAGTLDYVGATMNEATRTVKVRATVQNPDRLLRPGMFCEAAVAAGNDDAGEVLAVPYTALFADEGQSFVFRHWKDDLYVRQPVRRGRGFVGMAEIIEGLQPGDVIAAQGGFLLKSDVLREKMGAGCAD